ncbi:hypothetical protein CCO03_10495 [Comamonas serinivorans]|uniref:Acyltransferase n=1 Tax=Comamonas serinivorans TaxID=1082851 RepID=A0A1Y0ENS7_9BURK|nr:outer membrane lipoprotein carrier protein LolA [Comamonas serinivorans]ARU05061.1 hypothetical protein CCO03_10495 [Comamonas serinivorans]
MRSALRLSRQTFAQYALAAVFSSTAITGYCQSKPQGTPEFNANALMLLLAKHPSGDATFVETKHLALLAQPLVSKGTLNYAPPDKLAIRTTEPKPEAIVVDGDWLSRTADGKTRRIQLSAQPEATGIIEGIRGSLSGNRTALDQNFELSVSGSANQWRMGLVPKDSRVRKLITRIAIEGRQNAITRITTEQADGDRSVMDITPKP